MTCLKKFGKCKRSHLLYFSAEEESIPDRKPSEMLCRRYPKYASHFACEIKAHDQLAWARQMHNTYARAEEMLLHEMIYIE